MTRVADLVDQLKQAATTEELLSCLQIWNTSPALVKIKPADAAFAQTLVENVVPHLWTIDSPAPLTTALIQALSSLAGVYALLRHIRTSWELNLLQRVLESSTFSLQQIHDTWLCSVELSPATSDQLWFSYISLLTGSKLLNTLAGHTDVPLQDYWFAEAKGITQYVSQSILSLVSSYSHATERITEQKLDKVRIATLLSSMMNLGQSEIFYATLVLHLDKDEGASHLLGELLQSMDSAVKDRSMVTLCTFLEKEYFSHEDPSAGLINHDDRIGAAGTLIRLFSDSQANSPAAKWLLRRSHSYSLALRRAAILSISDTTALLALAQEFLMLWADQTQVRHAGVFVRRALLETLLLVIGRLPHQAQGSLASSALVMTGTSHHLESSSETIRAHGMILAEVMSEFANKSGIVLKFDVPATTDADAAYMRSLLDIRDSSKGISMLKSGQVCLPTETMAPIETSSVIIEEVTDLSDEESQAGDIRPLRLPDSDDEDSDEDPTLLDRDKIPPPLYIRTLIEQLTQHDSYKSIYSGLKHAPSLIQRKAHYGNELVNYATNLAEILSGLRDTFDMDDFQELRQQALVSLVAACPHKVGPYLSRAFFVADYSLQQRIVILSALALGSHRLAEKSTDLQEGSLLMPDALKQLLLAAEPQSTLQEMTQPNNLKSKTTWQTHILFPLLGNFQAYASHMVGKNATAFYESILLSYYIKTVSSVYAQSATCNDFRAMTTEVLQFVFDLQSQRDVEVCTALAGLVACILQVNDARTLAQDHGAALLALQDWSSTSFDTIQEPRAKALLAGISLKIGEIAKEKMDLLLAGSHASIDSFGTRFGMRGLH